MSCASDRRVFTDSHMLTVWWSQHLVGVRDMLYSRAAQDAEKDVTIQVRLECVREIRCNDARRRMISEPHIKNTSMTQGESHYLVYVIRGGPPRCEGTRAAKKRPHLYWMIYSESSEGRVTGTLLTRLWL
jgi:hypothetical protein